MYPKSLFSARQFPNEVYPLSFGVLLHRYSEVLLYVQNQLSASQIFGSARCPIVIEDEPFPIDAGPIAYIIPGNSTAIDSQHMGDGRYFYGFNGNFTIRVVDRSLRDYTQTDEFRLSTWSTSLLKIAHQVIDLFDIVFAEKITTPELPVPLYLSRVFAEQSYPSSIFPRSTTIYEEITQEPIVLKSHDAVRVRRKSSEWAGIDLNFHFPYTVEFQTPDNTANPIQNNSSALFNQSIFGMQSFPSSIFPQTTPTSGEPIPTDLGDLLLSVRDKITSQGFLNRFQAMISLSREPYPLVGGPYCTIRPGPFNMVSPNKYGAGRDYASMEGTFSVTPFVHNITDITGYANYSVSGEETDRCLYSAGQFLMENLCLSFLYDKNGNFIAENPLDLVRIEKPRYVSGSRSYVYNEMIFKVKYQERLS